MHHFQMRQLRSQPNKAHLSTYHIEELGSSSSGYLRGSLLILSPRIPRLVSDGASFWPNDCHSPELEDGKEVR
jgi:hypothetical protein